MLNKLTKNNEQNKEIIKKLDEESPFDNFIDSYEQNKEIIKKLDEEKFIPNRIKMFKIFMFVWSLDFLTTIIALNLDKYSGLLYETNPISNWFFSFGFLGYIGAFLYSLTTLFLLSWVICKLINKRIKSKGLKMNIYYGTIILFCIFEGSAIFNNIFWLVNY